MEKQVADTLLQETRLSWALGHRILVRELHLLSSHWTTEG